MSVKLTLSDDQIIVARLQTSGWSMTARPALDSEEDDVETLDDVAADADVGDGVDGVDGEGYDIDDPDTVDAGGMLNTDTVGPGDGVDTVDTVDAQGDVKGDGVDMVDGIDTQT